MKFEEKQRVLKYSGTSAEMGAARAQPMRFSGRGGRRARFVEGPAFTVSVLSVQPPAPLGPAPRLTIFRDAWWNWRT